MRCHCEKLFRGISKFYKYVLVAIINYCKLFIVAIACGFQRAVHNDKQPNLICNFVTQMRMLFLFSFIGENLISYLGFFFKGKIPNDKKYAALVRNDRMNKCANWGAHFPHLIIYSSMLARHIMQPATHITHRKI